MAEIKGLSYEEDKCIIISQTGGEINNDLIVDKNLTIDGDLITSTSSLKIVTFSDGTDDEIKAMLDAHYRGDINIEDYWSIGDTRQIYLKYIASPNKDKLINPWPAQNIVVVITAFNHHPLKEKIGIRTNGAITIETREVLNNITTGGGTEQGDVYINLNSDNDMTFTKWSELPLRSWMNNEFLNDCLPIKLRNMIKETKHHRIIEYNKKTTEEIIDKVFLPSIPEIYGNTLTYYYLNDEVPNNEEGTQWDYFKISSNRIKNGNKNGSANGIGHYWWTGSGSSDEPSVNGYMWMKIHYNGNCYVHRGSYAIGFAPAFVL